MNNNNFKVIRGGLLDSADTSRKEFVSAYITNTRLMGVMGMYVHFHLPDNKALRDLHQFFYFDAEEFGFESYESYLGTDARRVMEIENALIGGLGGEKSYVTLREAQFILQDYVRMNRKYKLPMPDGRKEYGFLLENDILLSDQELDTLMKKQCADVESPFEAINYFLMRCFVRDFDAAAYLCRGKFKIDMFPELGQATFCKNTIDDGDGPGSFICESVVEYNDNYYITVTNVVVIDLRVVSCERVSSFRISPQEAAMMLARSEFISVYEMIGEPSDFTRDTTRLTAGSMVTLHDIGVLYMIFHPNNKHVAKREFRLNEDVLGMYFVSDAGQVISSAHSLEEIQKLEFDLGTSPLARRLLPTAKYEFQEPVLYEFIQSGFDNFEMFVEAIKSDE